MISALRTAGHAVLLVIALSALGVLPGSRAWAQPSAAHDELSPSVSPASDADSTASLVSDVDSGGAQTSSAETASTGAPAQPSKDDPSGFSVNPVTGLVSASAANYEPLTGAQRWKLYWKQNFWSVGAYFGPFAAALVLDQTTDSPSQWGGGFSGYGKRVASRVGTAIVQGTVQALLAAPLHDDVRYIVSKEHGVKRRAWHAVVYSFATYNNHGHPTPNIANLSSYYAASAVSTTWLPGYHNVARYALIDGSESAGLSIPVNILQEFWPEIRHYVLHRH